MRIREGLALEGGGRRGGGGKSIEVPGGARGIIHPRKHMGHIVRPQGLGAPPTFPPWRYEPRYRLPLWNVHHVSSVKSTARGGLKTRRLAGNLWLRQVVSREGRGGVACDSTRKVDVASSANMHRLNRFAQMKSGPLSRVALAILRR